MTLMHVARTLSAHLDVPPITPFVQRGGHPKARASRYDSLVIILQAPKARFLAEKTPLRSSLGS